jgi:hypothetical protein
MFAGRFGRGTRVLSVWDPWVRPEQDPERDNDDDDAQDHEDEVRVATHDVCLLTTGCGDGVSTMSRACNVCVNSLGPPNTAVVSVAPSVQEEAKKATL